MGQRWPDVGVVTVGTHRTSWLRGELTITLLPVQRDSHARLRGLRYTRFCFQYCITSLEKLLAYNEAYENIIRMW